MPKSKSPDVEAKREGETCDYCNPPESLRRELGSRIGAYRFSHYLSYHSTEALAKHLRGTSWFTEPLKGADFETWLMSVLAWHDQRQRWRADDERRWGKE